MKAEDTPRRQDDELVIKLDKPEHGWSNLRVRIENKEYVYPISYLTDIVPKFLAAFERYYSRSNIGSAIEVEAEEFEWTLVVPESTSKHGLFIIADESDYIEENKIPILLHLSGISVDDFIQQVLNNIKENICDWTTFYSDNYYDSSFNKVDKQERLLQRINEVNEIRIRGVIEWTKNFM